jgi:hypothetical protein
VRNDGGSAFPRIMYLNVPQDNGMTLRDYFAAQIGRAVVPWDWDANTEGFPKYAKNFAKSCYALADAMLEARKE